MIESNIFVYSEETISEFRKFAVEEFKKCYVNKFFPDGRIDSFADGFNYGIKKCIDELLHCGIPDKMTFSRGKRDRVSTLFRGGRAAIREQKIFQQSVFCRDGFSCKKCGRNYSLEAHHIIPARMCDDNFIYSSDNGITLCRDCHKKFHSIYGIKRNSIDDITEFLGGIMEDE